MDRKAWYAVIHRVAKIQTWLRLNWTELIHSLYYFSFYLGFPGSSDDKASAGHLGDPDIKHTAAAAAAAKLLQSCPTLRDPMDCSLPESSVHGIFQARVLEWGALPSPIKHTHTYNYFSDTFKLKIWLIPWSKFFICFHRVNWFEGFPSNDKESAFQCRRHNRHRFNPWAGKIPRLGNGNLLQYSCLEKSMDRGAWQVTIHAVTKSWTQLDAGHCQWLDFIWYLQYLVSIVMRFLCPV